MGQWASGPESWVLSRDPPHQKKKKVNPLSHFSTLYYFQPSNLWSPLAPFLRETETCVRRVFCGKFLSEQLLFAAFCDIISIFCNSLKIYFPFVFINNQERKWCMSAFGFCSALQNLHIIIHRLVCSL